MITFNCESFREVYPELKPTLDRHYEEISNHVKHDVPLNPLLNVYYEREDNGTLLTVVGRDAGAVVAYYLCFVAPGLHYADCLTCTPDIFYVVPEKRSGGAGLRMFKYTESVLRQRGVKLWFVGGKVNHDASPLFRRMGFAPSEVTFSKWLD
jgi:GNAT superfamily N-acetyltransferase